MHVQEHTNMHAFLHTGMHIFTFVSLVSLAVTSFFQLSLCIVAFSFVFF